MSTLTIPLSKGLVAVIDAIDLGIVEPHKWCASVGKRGIYVLTNTTKPSGERTMLKLHRLITGATASQLVDYHNHDGLDNRRANLRLCNNSQNGGNSRAMRGSKSGYKGVTWHKQRGKWTASIMIARKFHYLGLFDDPWDAAQAYNAAAREAWCEFAHVNVRIVTELLGDQCATGFACSPVTGRRDA